MLCDLGRLPHGVTTFLVANAAASPGQVQGALIRPELSDYLDNIIVSSGAYKFGMTACAKA